MTRFKYKVRLYYDFEMQDCGEVDKHYAECEAIQLSVHSPQIVIEEDKTTDIFND